MSDRKETGSEHKDTPGHRDGWAEPILDRAPKVMLKYMFNCFSQVLFNRYLSGPSWVARWCMLVVPAIWKAESRGAEFTTSLGNECWETLSQKQTNQPSVQRFHVVLTKSRPQSL